MANSYADPSDSDLAHGVNFSNMETETPQDNDVEMSNTDEPLPNFSMSPADFIDPISTLTYEGLFGDHWLVQVTGHDAHLRDLSLAMDQDPIMISPQTTQNAFGETIKSLLNIGELQMPFNPVTVREVQEASRQNGVSVRDQTDPPLTFEWPNLDQALIMLALTAAREGSGQRWQIGLLTHVEGRNDVFLDMLSLQPESLATNTAWMYRRCSWNQDGSLSELWHAVSRRTLPTSIPQQFPLQDAFPTDIGSLQAPHATASIPRLPTAAVQPAAVQPFSGQPPHLSTVPTLQVQPAPRFSVYQPPNSSTRAKHKRPRTINAIRVAETRPRELNGVKGRLRPSNVSAAAFDSRKVFDGLTDDEVFGGDVHPDDICGTLIRDLATRHPNKDLAEKINALYDRLGWDRVNNNTICKRISNNHKANKGLSLYTAVGNDTDYQDARKELKNARKAANVKCHDGYGDQGKTRKTDGSQTHTSGSITAAATSGQTVANQASTLPTAPAQPAAPATVATTAPGPTVNNRPQRTRKQVQRYGQ